MNAAKKIIEKTQNPLQLISPDLQRSLVIHDLDTSSSFHVNSPAHQHISIGSQYELTDLLNHVISYKVGHFCQSSEESFASELNTAALMIHHPQQFLKHPLAAILSPLDCTQEKHDQHVKIYKSFQRIDEKKDLLDKIKSTLVQAGRTESLISDVLLITDEMFTNAIFNAPFVDPKTGYNPDIDRKDWSVSMEDQNKGEILVGFDEDRFVMACRDPYGSLDVKQLLIRLKNCSEQGVSTHMRMGQGGAGIGSYLIMNTGSSFYVGVDKGKMTVVASAIHWKWNMRRRSSSLKNIHYFQI